MFLIWGNKPTEKIIGTTNKIFHCDHCGNDVRFQLRLSRNWFTAYFIPIFPLSTKRRLECPICQYGCDVSKEKALEILAECSQSLK